MPSSIVYHGPFDCRRSLCYNPARRVVPMRPNFDLSSIRKKYGRSVRAVAVFFLLFTGADIALPQYFCGEEEIGGLPLTFVTQVPANVEADSENSTAIRESQGARPDRPAPEAPHEEDCFCCCAHVLPGLYAPTVAGAELKSPAIAPATDALPSPPLRDAYHPPRFA